MPAGERKRSRRAAVSLAAATLLTGPLLAAVPPVRAEGPADGTQLADLTGQPAPSELEAFLAFLERLVSGLVPLAPVTAPPATVAAPIAVVSPVAVVGIAPVATPVTVPQPPVLPMLRPAPGSLSRGFGYDGDHFHEGLDIDGETGDDVVAAAPGVVVATSCGSGYGNCTVVDHGHGLSTIYAHLSEQTVTSGSVERGQVIGLMGCTGSCTGSHLHFEVRVDDVAQDPMGFL